MGTFERIASLSVLIDDVAYERQSQQVSSAFERVSTTIVMRGGGHEGRGEDICYTPADHDLFPAPDSLGLAGTHTIETLSQHLDGRELFTGEPGMPAGRDYRRWAFESAALDLALRQAGSTLGEVVGREQAAVRFVVSTREDVRDWLALAPALEFKVDPISGEWDEAHMDALASTGRVRVCDLKAHYVGTPVDTAPDAAFHKLVADHFPDAVLEDASLAPDVLEALAGNFDRLSFDAPIHSLADLDALPMRVRHCNIKPSRFGTLSRLFECIDTCLERAVELYGGGQFELGVGRGQIQEIASLFYAGTPNDVAPPAYNAPKPVAGLPQSPLAPPPRRAGFGW
ncbi:MAG TPA: hypothetical protein VFD90_00550 [Gaiellales bacterium]|jgi:hypothetical protein|nr:hypothetical protein [Gaiellales bacterium]